MPKKESKFGLEPSKIKTIILALVIAIVLAFFVGYLIEAIYPSPDYRDYCGDIEPIAKPVAENQTYCESQGGTWERGYCSYYRECEEQYNNARDKYNLIIFVVSVIVGLIAVAAGISLQLTSVSSGLMLGGAFLTIYGTARYWYRLSNWIRVILLGIALVILVWLGYKKLKN